MSPEVCDPKRIYIGFEVKHLWLDVERKMLLLNLLIAAGRTSTVDQIIDDFVEVIV